MNLPDWVAGYVGLPFAAGGRSREGLDCWGLVRLVLAERFGVAVPAYDGARYDDETRDGLAALIARERDARWRELAAGDERPGDAVLLRIRRLPVPVGLVVARGAMLHIERTVDSCVDRYDRLAWRRRVIGFWRHPALDSSR